MVQHTDTHRPTVLVVGPPTSMMGGMARVVEQVLSLDGRAQYRVVPFETTFSRDNNEGRGAAVARHLRHLRFLRKTIRRHRTTIVHVHTCSGFSFYRAAADMLLARRARCRTILHIHGASFDTFYESAGRMARFIIGWLLGRADLVVALSENWKTKLLAMSPKARVTVIENAVDIPPDVPPACSEQICQFALLAKMDEWKGIDDLLSACAILRRDGLAFRMVMAGPPGSAGDGASINAIIRQLDLVDFVRYVGPVQGRDKTRLLRESHAYVQPSRHEGMPLAILEAMAHALPIVATRVGAVPEVVTDGREGILVSPREPAQLADAMRKLILDKDLRIRMAAAARVLTVKRFGMDRFRRDILSLYDDVCARSGLERVNQTANTAKPPSRASLTTA